MVEGILVPVKGQIKNDSNYKLVEKSNISWGKETKVPSQTSDWSFQVGGPVSVDQCKKNTVQPQCGFTKDRCRVKKWNSKKMYTGDETLVYKLFW